MTTKKNTEKRSNSSKKKERQINNVYNNLVNSSAQLRKWRRGRQQYGSDFPTGRTETYPHVDPASLVLG
jgi:hypothetical protein